ncbi:MAG: outer membrane beta-barrel protein [Muribaculaceae bacterium]|nr:outer membrane beta-barrel protein [Muribaculaceae bacterium]
MNRIFLFICAATVALTSHAGGLLANTNQNAAFLRNPARDAVIAIDGVYSNPAGTAFLPEGLHLSLSWQAAFQKRQMEVNNNLFTLNKENQSPSRNFEGKATAPVIPSFQAAYVFNDKWSVSAQFAVGGGGGKCEFEQGLPMFEELIGGIVAKNGGESYQLRQNLTGEQYFYGLQVGGTYKFNNNVSVFAGVRGVLASCSYTGAINNIKANGMSADEYTALSQQAIAGAEQAAAVAAQYAALGMTEEAQKYTEKAATLQASAAKAGTIAAMIGDYQLDCSQDGFGVTPIIGVDVNLGKLNLAAKYEFRTKINLENESDNSENLAQLATQVPAVAVYADGAKVRSDIPALFTFGAQYQVSNSVRAMAGYHLYFDKDAQGSATAVSKNTWEITAGVEWDLNDKILLSLGGQRTKYGFADSDMTDTNFNISSIALCLGGAYKFNDRMKLNVGYMHSFYEDHKFTNANGSACNYTRKNDVVGVSFDISF